MAATRSILIDIEERKRGTALVGAADDMDKLAAETEKAENKFKLFNQDMAKVQTEVERSTAKVAELRKEIARTGDQSLFGDLRKEEANLRRFENLAKNLEKDAKAAGTIVFGAVADWGKEAEKAAASAGSSWGDVFSKSVSGGITSPAALTAIGALVTATLPVLGAAVAGSVVGLVGTGGIIGGVLAASHDPRVEAAFGELGETAKDTFFGAGGSFVDPVLSSVRILERELDSINLGKTFGLAAPDLEIITHGLADLVTNVLPGLNLLLARSGPFAQVAAAGFADFGSALGEFFDNSSKSRGALEGLDFLFKFVNGSIRTVGVSLGWLSDRLHEFNSVGSFFFDHLDAALTKVGLHNNRLHALATELDLLVHGVGPAGQLAQGLGAALDRLGLGAKAASNDISDLVKELEGFKSVVDNIIGNTLGVDEALTAAKKGMNDLAQALQENGSAWQGNTAAALANQDAVYQQIAAFDRLRQAEIKNGTSAADANAEFEANVQQLLDMAKAAGISKDALEDLARKYIIQVEIASSLPAIGAAIAAEFTGALQHGGGLAAGGPALPGMSYTVGESGMERLDVLPGGGAVVTPLGGGGQAVNVTIVIPGGDLGSAMVAHLAKHAQVYGGGNVQLAITGRLN